MSHEKRIRKAALFVLAGLLVQLFATLFWTPLTFVAFTVVGVPLVLLGVLLYGVTVWRILKEQKAL
jgi:predicted membrane channel-forming protein YqfA (hemolysin III family)